MSILNLKTIGIMRKKLKRCLFIFSYLIVLSAFSAPLPPFSTYQTLNFKELLFDSGLDTKKKNIPYPVRMFSYNFDIGLAVIPLFQKVKGKYGGCSGVLISNEGHVLTALHCLTTHRKIEFSKLDFGKLSFYSVDKKQADKVIDLGENVYGIPRYAKIIATGKGHFANYNKKKDIRSEESEELLLQRYHDDYAIIQLQLPQNKLSHCAKIEEYDEAILEPQSYINIYGYAADDASLQLSTIFRHREHFIQNDRVKDAIENLKQIVSEELTKNSMSAIAMTQPFVYSSATYLGTSSSVGLLFPQI